MTSCANKNNFRVLKDPYLGPKPPGKTLEVFAPGIVTTEKSEMAIAISPDLNEIFFMRRLHKVAEHRIWYSRVKNGKLMNSQITSFSSDCNEGYPCFSPDGKRLYYVSRRPVTDKDTVSVWGNIWFADRKKDGWSEPELLDSPINDLNPHFLSMDNEGTLYFGSGLRCVYSAKWSDGGFLEAVKLPDKINYFESVSHPGIAPDGRYLLVDAYWKKGDHTEDS